jgi:hypothetical protein
MSTTQTIPDLEEISLAELVSETLQLAAVIGLDEALVVKYDEYDITPQVGDLFIETCIAEAENNPALKAELSKMAEEVELVVV